MVSTYTVLIRNLNLVYTGKGPNSSATCIKPVLLHPAIITPKPPNFKHQQWHHSARFSIEKLQQQSQYYKPDDMAASVATVIECYHHHSSVRKATSQSRLRARPFSRRWALFP